SDESNRPEGRDVTKKVDDQNIQCKSTFAHIWKRYVRQSGIGRPSIEKQQENCSEHEHPGQWKWSEQHCDKQREGYDHANSRDQKIGRRITLSQSACKHAANDRRDQ